MTRQTIDGNTRFNYEITGYTRLMNWVGERRVSEKQGEKILTGLIDCLSKLELYFLNIPQCVLQEEYIFVDELLNIYLPYLPVERSTEGDVGKTLSEFFLSVLGSCLSQEEGNAYYDGLLRYLIRPGFELKKFRKLAAPDTESRRREASPAKPAETAVPVAAAADKAVIVEKSQTAQPQTADTGSGAKNRPTADPMGFAIPGGGPPVSPPPTKEKKKKEKAERKAKEGKKRFGFSFGKKQTRDLDMNQEEFVTPSEDIIQSHPISEPVYQDAAEWKGTVQLQKDDSATVLLSGETSTAALHYAGRQIALTSFPFKIGKINAHLVIGKETISRTHATVTRVGDSYFITDENSKNHTYVNGQMIPPYSPFELQDKDVVRLANEEMIFKKGG